MAGASVGFALLAKRFILHNIESANKEYEEFKKDFKNFIFEEYDRLGESAFYAKYPLEGFSDFIR